MEGGDTGGGWSIHMRVANQDVRPAFVTLTDVYCLMLLHGTGIDYVAIAPHGARPEAVVRTTVRRSQGRLLLYSVQTRHIISWGIIFMGETLHAVISVSCLLSAKVAIVNRRKWKINIYKIRQVCGACHGHSPVLQQRLVGHKNGHVDVRGAEGFWQ